MLEISFANYVPNSFVSGGENSHVKILTGPNRSGKSIYMKQVATIIYLAHVGSFVPAKTATIGLLHSIHSRITTVESATAETSSFLSSIQQVKTIFINLLYVFIKPTA